MVENLFAYIWWWLPSWLINS